MSTDSPPDAIPAPAQPKRKRTVSLYWVLAVEVLVVLCLKGGDWANQLQFRAELLGVHWVVLALGWLVGLPVLYFLMIMTHEGGHVLGGRLAGFRILTFSASWLRLTRKAAGWQIRFVKPPAKLGGMVQATPNHAGNLRGRYSLFVAGGPVANLATGALALYLHQQLATRYALPLMTSLGGYLLLNALPVYGWLSVAIGGLNLLPLNLKSGHIIDGRRLWQFLRGGPAMHQQLGLLYFQSLMSAGLRPREWDAALVAQFIAHRSNTVLDCYAHLCTYSYFLDCNDLEMLRFHLNLALDSVAIAPVSIQQHVLCEAAYVAALHTNNTEQARYWLNRAQAAKPFTPEEGLLARAAVAYAEGQLQESESWLEPAIKQIEDCIPSGGTVQAAERLYDLQAKVRQARRVPSETNRETALTA